MRLAPSKMSSESSVLPRGWNEPLLENASQSNTTSLGIEDAVSIEI